MFYSRLSKVLIVVSISMCRAQEENAQEEQENTTTTKSFDGFVVGGRYASIEEFPHSAFLAISCFKEGEFHEFACGSSVLNQYMLLTAAHCFEGCKAGTKISGSVGESNKRKKKVFQIASFINHPRYDGIIMANDIALAMAKDKLLFGKMVKRVVLSRKGIFNEPAVLAGWGVTNEEHVTDTLFLKATKQIVWTKKKCRTVFPRLHDGFLCASGDTSAKDFGYAAVGDSGSALLVRGYLQIGVVSHKISEVSKSLIVYSDVAYYYKWIEATTRGLYCRGRKLRK